METIKYQGQDIQAEKIAEIGGYMGSLRGRPRNGEDELWRDEEGCYYLRQRRYTETEDGPQFMYEAEDAGVLFDRVHAIGINAAILWAINNLAGDSFELRADAAGLLMENRGYVDPNPVHLTPAQRAELRTGAMKETDGSMSVTIRFVPACAALLRAASERLEQNPVTFVYQATESGVRGLLARSNVEERRIEDLFDDNAPEEREEEVASSPALQRTEPEAAAPVAEGPDRITVELDDFTSAMLRKTCKEGDPCRHAGENLHDLVNAAVTFYLCDDRKDSHGEFDLSCGDQALERAKRDRLRLEAAAPEPQPAICDHADEPEAVGNQPGVHRFTFDYPATKQFCGMQRTVELSDEQMERARELAAIFGLDLLAFLRGLVHHNALPGQPRADRSDEKLKGLLQAEHIRFFCSDAAMARRIERAAQACGQAVDEFVADALGADVDMYEENMLLHPATGDLLGTDFEDLYSKVEEKVTVPPVGRENDPQWKMQWGKEFVNFSLYLRPEQLKRLKYPLMVRDSETDELVSCVLIPLDPEGNPVLRVGKRYVEPGKPIPKQEAASTTEAYADQSPVEGEKRRFQAAHTLTIELTRKQYRMLWHSARYDEQTVEEFAMWELRNSVTSTLSQCYDHDEEEAGRAWDEPAAWSTVPTVYLVSRSTLETAAHSATQVGVTVDEMIVSALERVKEDAHAKWAGKHHVTLSVWLTEEQMRDRLRTNFPLTGSEPRLPYFTLPLPLDGSPRLTIDGKATDLRLTPLSHERAEATEPPVALSVRLDVEATAFLRRYLRVTPWEYTASDILNGCVVHALRLAFDNVEEAVKSGHLDSGEFHDGEWGFIEADILDATLRRTGKSDVDARVGWSKEKIEAEILPRTKLVEVDFFTDPPADTGRRHAKPNPAGLALVAASEPEEEPLPEEVHTDEPETPEKPEEGTEPKDRKEAQ